MYFCTKIYDLVKNNAHHGEKNPNQEVGDDYIFKNHSESCTLPEIELL